ncbi:MAG: glycosyltransferase family 1 protein [Burkholderiales bacterium]|nr:glycosyltransferase family 1 protein [Burkholderiales bacterium]
MPRVYFYCRNEEGNLQEDVIALAEGLRDLGVPFSGSCDYWLESTEPGDYLIRHDPAIRPEDCDVVVVSYTWPYWIRMKTFDLVRRPLPEGLFKTGRKYKTVYMDSHDGHRTVSWEPEFRQFDLILRSKLNRRAWHPENVRPWVLGFTRRILSATADAPPFEKRAATLLWNFGASHPYSHGVRTLAERTFVPAIEPLLVVDRTKDNLATEPADAYERLMWHQTGGRFSGAYYARLKASRAVACFCGELIPPLPYRNPECYLVGGNRARIRRTVYGLLGQLDSRAPRLVQWDSFRFWESLISGCVAFNPDLERYGAQLPVMPENWKDYIGVDFTRVSDAIERIRADPGCLERIANEGPRWALENYSPRRMAERFLEHAGMRIAA